MKNRRKNKRSFRRGMKVKGLNRKTFRGGRRL